MSLPLKISGAENIGLLGVRSAYQKAVREVMEGGEQLAGHYLSVRTHDEWGMEDAGWVPNHHKSNRRGKIVFEVRGSAGQSFPLTDEEKLQALEQLGIVADVNLSELVNLYREKVALSKDRLIDLARELALALQTQQSDSVGSLKQRLDELCGVMWTQVLYLSALNKAHKLAISHKLATKIESVGRVT